MFTGWPSRKLSISFAQLRVGRSHRSVSKKPGRFIKVFMGVGDLVSTLNAESGVPEIARPSVFLKRRAFCANERNWHRRRAGASVPQECFQYLAPHESGPPPFVLGKRY